MSASEMVCHLRDAFAYSLGGRAVAPVKVPIPRSLFKWLALRAPLQWRPGIKTPPELDQRIGGTRPVDFETDRADLLSSLNEFVRSGLELPHPMFGAMSSDDWMRWGYLHCDHHLRQFGR